MLYWTFSSDVSYVRALPFHSEIVVEDCRTLSQNFCIGKIEKGSSSWSANSSIPNRNSPTITVVGIRGRHCKKCRVPEEAWFGSMNTSCRAAGSNSIHKLKKRPVCLVSFLLPVINELRFSCYYNMYNRLFSCTCSTNTNESESIKFVTIQSAVYLHTKGTGEE